MGVDRTDYLMFGFKVSPSAVGDNYEKFEPMMDGAPEAPFDLVYDGMSGEYAVAGKIIAKLADYDGMVFTEITDALLPKDPDSLATRIAEAFGLSERPILKLYLFSHFS